MDEELCLAFSGGPLRPWQLKLELHARVFDVREIAGFFEGSGQQLRQSSTLIGRRRDYFCMYLLGSS